MGEVLELPSARAYTRVLTQGLRGGRQQDVDKMALEQNDPLHSSAPSPWGVTSPLTSFVAPRNIATTPSTDDIMASRINFGTMLPRFEVAGFAIACTIVFFFGSRFSPSFYDLDTSLLSYGDASAERDPLDDVEPPNPFEDLTISDVFTIQPEESGKGEIEDTMNSTLGFGRVFVVSMPERSDKRDAFSLQARLSNITFEVRDGVSGADVPPKALPLVSIFQTLFH